MMYLYLQGDSYGIGSDTKTEARNKTSNDMKVACKKFYDELYKGKIETLYIYLILSVSVAIAMIIIVALYKTIKSKTKAEREAQDEEKRSRESARIKQPYKTAPSVDETSRRHLKSPKIDDSKKPGRVKMSPEVQIAQPDDVKEGKLNVIIDNETSFLSPENKIISPIKSKSNLEKRKSPVAKIRRMPQEPMKLDL